jgi:glycosyltransferase involved in cell wall biosynthesis
VSPGVDGPGPSFTTLIANFNHAGLVGRAIDSALAQRGFDGRHDVVVVDDGSTDDSWARLQAWAGHPAVRLVQQPNRGQTAAYAAALAAASGDWVCLLDADDRAGPDRLARVAQAIAASGASPGNGFISHDARILQGADGEAIDDTWFDVGGLHRLAPRLHVSAVQHFFPFAITSGQVYGRPLLHQVVQQVPLWDWPMGADMVFGHLALLLAGEVQLLPEPLSDYVVHGGNNFASIEGGRFRQKPVWHDRWPRFLRLLERVLDQLPLSATDRADRLGCIGRVEHAVRALPAGRPAPQPCLSFVIDAHAASPAAVQATQAALASQTHGRWQAVWVGLAGAAPDGGLAVNGADRHGPYARLRAGVQAATGGYLCLLRAGDRPDHRFAERHLHVHRHGPATTLLSACDLRLRDADGHLLHLGVQGQAGGWTQPQSQVPALATALGEWALAPLPAVVLRRTAFVDAFFAPPQFNGPERLAPWLLLQGQLQLGGATRLLENLVDLQIGPDRVANPFWFAGPCDHDGPLPAPDLAWAAEQLFATWGRAGPGLHRSYPPAWEARFLRWLLQAGGAALAQRLPWLAQASGDADWADRVQRHLAALRRA